MKSHQTGLPSLLHYTSAVWVKPYKRAPRIEIQQIELTLSQSNWSYATIVYPHLHLHQLVRVAPFQPIRMVLFGPIKLWAFGVICTETDQSGTRMRTSLCKNQSASPLSLNCLFSVSTEDCVSPAGAVTSRTGAVTPARAITQEQSRAVLPDWRCNSGAASPRWPHSGHLTSINLPKGFHSHAVS